MMRRKHSPKFKVIVVFKATDLEASSTLRIIISPQSPFPEKEGLWIGP